MTYMELLGPYSFDDQLENLVKGHHLHIVAGYGVNACSGFSGKLAARGRLPMQCVCNRYFPPFFSTAEC